ncbi:hypothetical protein [Sphingobium chungbukense]|uniref:hypothetical protein n=1 Tax=Sphingobium chungbukense TaxID=56193 RepID=UPI000A65F5AA|nr:hypothetical protein [Sphingobium chungbukense]
MAEAGGSMADDAGLSAMTLAGIATKGRRQRRNFKVLMIDERFIGDLAPFMGGTSSRLPGYSKCKGGMD